MIKNDFDKKAIGAIRYIGLKGIQIAGGGHVGMTISAAPITYTLFTRFIKLNPHDGKWINRDRFVLSAGHGSMCLYPIFYLSGIFTKKDIEDFKVKNSKTPGHPEYENKKSNFIDASTGPLGQGIAMGVGMALAEQHARNITKNNDPNLFNHWTYVLCGDGDLQEGISYEAMAIAGKYKLNKLIVLHDSNKFQLDSSVEEVSVENLKQRVESNNWLYLKCSNNPDDIEAAIKQAQKSTKPTFIEVDTIIAEGLSTGNTHKGHHGVITDDDLVIFSRYHGLSFKDWDIDQNIFKYFEKNVVKRGLKEYKKWESNFNKRSESKSFEKITQILNNKLSFKKIFKSVKIETNNLATRAYLKPFLNSLNKVYPFVLSACADVTSSTNIRIGDKNIMENGQFIPIGIREAAMGAIMNGISLYGAGFKVVGGTFLVFADYMKPAIRLSGMMKQPVIYIFTHDSYLVGGDGPTHQPYDQIPMLRAIQNVNVYRPADEEELRYCFIDSFNSKNETAVIVLSRQNIKSLGNIQINEEKMKEGAYIVKDVKNPDYVIAASGSEVQLALSVANELRDEKIKVVSVPCLDKVVNLSESELRKLFKANKCLLTIEASSCFKWSQIYLNGQRNVHLGAYTFGSSMDGGELYEEKGFNKEFIIKLLKDNKK